MDYASPKLVDLFLNATARTIQKGAITKTITDKFWTEHIAPILYPLWDSDRDKLETFVLYNDGSMKVIKNKYQRNQKTGEYKWVEYVFDHSQLPQSEVDESIEKLTEKYVEFKGIDDLDMDRIIKKLYARDNSISFNKILVIRKFLLIDSDWTQLPDNSLSEEDKELWRQYRQKLRDIHNDHGGVPPAEVPFPITPTKYKELAETGQDMYGLDNYDTSVAYLADPYNHFYRLSQQTFAKFSGRVVAYLSILAGTVDIDDVSVARILMPWQLKAQYNPDAQDTTLDALLENIENGEL